MGAAWRGALMLTCVALAGAWLFAPRPCAADAAAPPPPACLDEVALDAFVCTSYGYNWNRPASGANQVRVFDFADDTFQLDVFELVAQKPPATARTSGWRVDLAAGSSVPKISAATGLFRDATGAAGDIDLQQAFVSYVAPLGSGLRVDAGKFVTHFGYEVIEGYDGWNDDATRSFLFGYAIPFTHVGARASYAWSPRLSTLLMLVNGWDVARDNNRSKSVGAQIPLTPVAALSVILNAMTGPERTADDADPRTLLDLVAIWKAGARLTLGVNADRGTDRSAVANGGDAGWSGVAGYLRLGVTAPFALSLRAESFDDRDGARTGTAQSLAGFTATPELRLTPRLVVRGDFRVDRSNRRVFEKAVGFAHDQPTVLIEALYGF